MNINENEDSPLNIQQGAIPSRLSADVIQFSLSRLPPLPAFYLFAYHKGNALVSSFFPVPSRIEAFYTRDATDHHLGKGGL